jgi:KDO2-lipid IV(A) lauroyltransferase
LSKLFVANLLRKPAARSPWLLRRAWSIEAALIAALWRLSRNVSPDRASDTGRRLLRIVGPRLHKTAIVRRNLQIAFPEKSAGEIEQLVQEVWGNLGAILAEYPHLGIICSHEAASRLEIVRRGDSDVFSEGGGPAVFVTAHLANWEVAAGAVVWQGIPLTGIYTPIHNPQINDMLYRAREELNCGMVKREGAVRQLVKALKKGVSVGLIVDQRVDSGEPVPFFGHDMKTSITPAQLALRAHCALIPVQVQRLAGARFRVIFHEAVQPDDVSASEREKILQMTRKVTALFESWIRERPHEWMCTKRRWPKQLEAQLQAPSSTGT